MIFITLYSSNVLQENLQKCCSYLTLTLSLGGGHDVDGARHSTSEADSSTAAATAPNGVTLSEKNEMWRTVALFDYSRYVAYPALHRNTRHYATLHYIHCTALHCSALHYLVMHYLVMHCAVLRDTTCMSVSFPSISSSHGH